MSKQSRHEFKLYLQQCTDAQVRAVYEKEKAASRDDYADLAYDEYMRRAV